jgi:polysaccharide deacetylase 2 family uncharacterized protein YibQ
VTRARISGWRGLGLFWAVVLLALAGGAGTLAWLGPPPAPVTAEASPPAPAEPVPVGPAPPPVAAIAPAPAPILAPLPPPPAEARPALRANARAFDRTDPRPRVAIIVGALGAHAQVAEQALRLLPPATGLAFSPYAEASQRLVGLARARGFETLLALPLEPTGFPLNDPGPRALLTGLPWAENAQRLDWLLARQTGHVGVVAALGPMRGERFAALVEPFVRVQDTVAARGLLFVDARPGAPAPARAWGRSLDLVLDDPPTRAELELRLGQLERIARERGAALGYLGEAGPIALERIAQWAAGLEARGLVLAPPSALARAPEVALR